MFDESLPLAGARGLARANMLRSIFLSREESWAGSCAACAESQAMSMLWPNPCTTCSGMMRNLQEFLLKACLWVREFGRRFGTDQSRCSRASDGAACCR